MALIYRMVFYGRWSLTQVWVGHCSNMRQVYINEISSFQIVQAVANGTIKSPTVSIQLCRKAVKIAEVSNVLFLFSVLFLSVRPSRFTYFGKLAFSQILEKTMTWNFMQLLKIIGFIKYLIPTEFWVGSSKVKVKVA